MHRAPPRVPYIRVVEPERNEGSGTYRYYWRGQRRNAGVRSRYLDDKRLRPKESNSASGARDDDDSTTQRSDALPLTLSFAEFVKLVKYKHAPTWDQRLQTSNTSMLRSLFDSMDEGRDGMIGRQDYLMWCLPRAFLSDERAASVRKVFDECSGGSVGEASDGFIDLKELRLAWSAMGFGELAPRMLEHLSITTREQGRVECDELIQAMKRKCKSRKHLAALLAFDIEAEEKVEQEAVEQEAAAAAGAKEEPQYGDTSPARGPPLTPPPRHTDAVVSHLSRLKRGTLESERSRETLLKMYDSRWHSTLAPEEEQKVPVGKPRSSASPRLAGAAFTNVGPWKRTSFVTTLHGSTNPGMLSNGYRSNGVVWPMLGVSERPEMVTSGGDHGVHLHRRAPSPHDGWSNIRERSSPFAVPARETRPRTPPQPSAVVQALSFHSTLQVSRGPGALGGHPGFLFPDRPTPKRTPGMRRTASDGRVRHRRAPATPASMERPGSPTARPTSWAWDTPA